MAYGSLDNLKFSDRDRYTKMIGRLKIDRSSFDSHWKEIGDWLLPRRIRFQANDRNRGDKRNQNIINSAAKFASRTLASGMHSGLTSPARPWFKLSTPDPTLAAYGPVKEYLHDATQRMISVFLTTNLYTVLPTVYSDMGNFATGAMSILNDSKDLFRARSYPIGSYWCGLDARGNVTTFVYEFEMTVRQIIEEFAVPFGTRLIDWSKVSVSIKNAWDEGNYEQSCPVTWVVMPNDRVNPDALDAKDRLPWRSCYFETSDRSETKGFLRESGFAVFPVMVPRWDVTGNDTYGTDCPGMTALGDIKQLQIEERRKGQAISKGIDPPLVGPSSLKSQKTSLLPGDITYQDVREGIQGLRAIHEVNLNLQHLGLDIDAVTYRIQRAYYEDLWLMLARSDGTRGAQPVTAREIDERHEEKLLALGPVLEHTNDELLEPLIDRVWQMMEERELLPPAPPELDGVELKVEYISIMAQAQKLVGLVGQDRFMQTVLNVAEAFPEVRYKVDINQFVDDLGDMTGIDPRMIVPTEDARKAAAAAAEQQNSAASAEQTEMMASAAQKLGQTPVTGDSALTRIASAAASQAVA